MIKVVAYGYVSAPRGVKNRNIHRVWDEEGLYAKVRQLGGQDMVILVDQDHLEELALSAAAVVNPRATVVIDRFCGVYQEAVAVGMHRPYFFG